MIGDWIKMRTDIYRDPKVCMMADFLMDPDGDLARHVRNSWGRDMSVTRNVTRHVTVGALVTVWGVTRHRGKRDGCDLVLRGVTKSVIDDVADLPGFGNAMASVGWLLETDAGIVFPRFFEEFNADPAADQRAKAAERQRKHRQKDVSRLSRDKSVTVTQSREEESREEESRDLEQKEIEGKPSETDDTHTNSEKPKPKRKSRSPFVAPTVTEVAAYCAERGNTINPERFVDFYAAKGWMVGSNKMIDWKACVRNWEKTEAERQGPTKPATPEKSFAQREAEAIAEAARQREKLIPNRSQDEQ